MNSDKRFRWLVFTAAMLAIFTYAVADESWIFGGLALCLAVIGWNVTEKRGGRAVPRALIATAIVLAILWAIASAMRERLNVAHFCEFTISVLVIKCYDRRTSADLGQFVMLCLFLSIGALLTSNSLWMALALIPTLLYAVAASVGYQFHLGRVAARRSAAQAPGAPSAMALASASSSPRKPHAPAPAVVHGVVHPSIRGLVRTLALGWFIVVGVSLAVFIAFPRNVGADSFGRWGNAGVGMQTGFNDQVTLGEGGLISTSSAPVLDLTVRGTDGRTLGAPEETYYLRGAVLDTYRNGRWTAPENGRQRINDLSAGLDFGLTTGRGGSGARGSTTFIELDIMIRNARAQNYHLFSVWRPRVIEFESRAVIRYGEDNGVLIREGQSGRVRYTIVCEHLEPAIAIPPDRVRTPVSHDSRPIAGLATQILRDAGLDPDPATRPLEDDAAAAAAIERYFDTGFEYTLDISSPSDNTDPIEWFLFDEKRGHCEYYASAMVALCRSVGINSRVVTGFVATEFNEATRHYVVRESNAHAWVEVEVMPPKPLQREAIQGESSADLFQPGTSQWQTRDPTPSGEFRRIHRPEATLASQIRNLFEAVNYAWITSIVAFDDNTRTSLVSAMSIDTSVLDRWAEDASNRVRLGGPGLVTRALTNALIAAISVLCLGLAITLGGPALKAFWFTLLARMARFRGGARSARINQLAGAGFYTRLLHALARKGHAKPAWQPPLAHARGLGSDELAPPASRVAEAFYRVRFGHADLSAADRAAINADLASLNR